MKWSECEKMRRKNNTTPSETQKWREKERQCCGREEKESEMCVCVHRVHEERGYQTLTPNRMYSHTHSISNGEIS